MRKPAVWVGGALALAAALATSGASAQQSPVTLQMEITENRIHGAAGTVTMTPLANNQARVDIRITGLQAGQQHAAHIHTADGARCDNGAPITYPLTNVSVDAAGVGTSSTTITLTADKPIRANNAYVNVHQNATGGPGVICADVTASFTATASGAAPTATASGAAPSAQQPATGATQPSGGAQALPATGAGDLTADQPRLTITLLALLAALGGLTADGRLLSRRRA